MDFINHRQLHLGAKNKKFALARSFRKAATEAEDILWNEIRNKRIKGFKFRRQHPLSNYIADFYCHEARLVIEVDGEIHEHSKEYDECRSSMLSELGIKVIRFKNDEIVNDLNSVISRIYLELEQFVINSKFMASASCPSPVRRGGRG